MWVKILYFYSLQSKLKRNRYFMILCNMLCWQCVLKTGYPMETDVTSFHSIHWSTMMRRTPARYDPSTALPFSISYKCLLYLHFHISVLYQISISYLTLIYSLRPKKFTCISVKNLSCKTTILESWWIKFCNSEENRGELYL